MPVQHTKPQNCVVMHRKKHALVPAAPGSGKTTTLTSFLVSIIQDGTLTDPNLAIVLMFGKDARIDFEKKLASTAPESIGPLPTIKTFHSLANHLCNVLMERNLLPRARLESSEGKLRYAATQAMRRHVSAAEWKELTSGDNKVVDVFLQYIDLIKSDMQSASLVFEMCCFDDKLKFFVDAYDTFEQTRKNASIRYFSDLLTDLVVYLIENPHIAQKLADQRSHIIVDEAQDMNVVQYTLVKILAGVRAGVMLVGDLDQSIYAWRGSKPSIMLKQFKEDFGEVEIYPMPDTFRFGPKLSLMANSLIQHNTERLDTLCRSHPNAKNFDTEIFVHSSDEEGESAIDIIKDARNRGVPFAEIMVLCRLYSASSSIELACLNAGFPIQVDSGRGVMSTKETSAISSLLMIASGQMGTVAKNRRATFFEELLRYPHVGLPGNMLEATAKRLASRDNGYGTALSQMEFPELSGYQKKRLRERGAMLSSIERRGDGQRASEMLTRYSRETDLYKSLAKLATTDQDAAETVDRSKSLISYATKRKGTSSELLAHFSELKSADNNSGDTIRVTSIFKAKGLERQVILVPGANDARFPYKAKGEYVIQSELEEERRLFFVGITRGIDEVHIFGPNDQDFERYMQTGTLPRAYNDGNKDGMSRFVYEMSWRELKDYQSGKFTTKDKKLSALVSRYEEFSQAS